jgi:hypothetical protein
MRISILFILFITKSIALAQQSNAFFAATDSLSTNSYKHQIGIGLSKFVNAAFPTDSNAFLLEYRYLKTPSLAYRIATDYRTESSKDSYYEFALKVGVDKKLKNYNKWQFYYGIDLWGRYLYYGNRKQHYTNVALNPFLGILFHFSKNFSVATEPGFFIKYNIRRDRKSFDPEAQAQWFESRLAKIGVIQLNFHF